VRAYYDANTRKFLVASSQGAIHRELWGPGVGSRAAAVHHAHALVLEQLGRDDRRVLDLGCGVGSGALYLAERRPVDVLGVSVSPEQIRLAERYAEGSDRLRGSVAFVVADFTALPEGITGFDLAYAIESFVHADPAAAFFAGAARALSPGGALVVIDDVLTGDPGDQRAVDRLEDFRAGWHVSSLLPEAGIAALAVAAGLPLPTAGTAAGPRHPPRATGAASPPGSFGLGRVAGRGRRAAAVPPSRSAAVPHAALHPQVGLTASPDHRDRRGECRLIRNRSPAPRVKGR
jgi:SAM-dependent methyltransferase